MNFTYFRYFGTFVIVTLIPYFKLLFICVCSILYNNFIKNAISFETTKTKTKTKEQQPTHFYIQRILNQLVIVEKLQQLGISCNCFRFSIQRQRCHTTYYIRIRIQLGMNSIRDSRCCLAHFFHILNKCFFFLSIDRIAVI